MKYIFILLLIGSCLAVLAQCKSKHKKVSKNEEQDVDLSDKKDDKEQTSESDLNEDAEQDDDDDDDEISSGSGEDLDKRKQVKPEKEEDLVSWKCEDNACSACVDLPLVDEKCIEAKAIREDNGTVNAIKFSYLSDGKLKKNWEKKVNSTIVLSYKFVEITLYDISIAREKFGGCAKIKISLPIKDIKHDFKCWHYNFTDAPNQSEDDVPIRIRHGRWLPRRKPKTSKQ